MPSPPSKQKEEATAQDASSSSSRRGSCWSMICAGPRRKGQRGPFPSSNQRPWEERFVSGNSAACGDEEQSSTPRRVVPPRAQPMDVHLSNYMKGALRWGSGVSFTQTKRGREINEDSYLLETRELPSGSSLSLIGVFDGHGNEQLSHWLSLHFADVFFRVFTIFQQAYGLPDMIEYIRKLFPSGESFKARSKRLLALNCPDVVTLSLCASFAVCEEQAMSLAHIDTAHGGSCATVIGITHAGFFVAKAGDCSAALVCRKYPSSFILRTSDHRTVNRPDEVSRVIALGGAVYKGNSVGMAFSSLGVTRTLGDTLWRANDDWKRDMTRDSSSNQPAIDESLSQFSRLKGCVGVTSDPEWYSCCCHGGRSQGEEVVHWAISSNSPPEYTTSSARVFKGVDEDLKFFLILGSDGFWETQAVGALLQALDSSSKKFNANDLSLLASQAIGTSPHDDSTVIVVELSIEREDLDDGGGSSQHTERRRAGSSGGDILLAKRNIAPTVKRRTTSGSVEPNGPLDYLFK